MGSPHDLFGAPWTFTRTSPLAVSAGLVASGVASAVTPVVVLPAAMNGTDGGSAGAFSYLLPAGAGQGPARTLSVTTSAHAATYKTGASFPITVKGLYNGAAVTENLLLTATNGGETILGAQMFDTVTEIDIPAQNDALGAFTFGVVDVCAPGKNGTFRGVKPNAAGNVGVKYQQGTTDVLTGVAGVIEPILPERVLSATTAVGVTIYA